MRAPAKASRRLHSRPLLLVAAIVVAMVVLRGRMGGGQEQQRAKLLSEEQAVSQGNAAAAGTAAATGGQHEAQQASLHATEGEQQQPKKKKAGSSAQQSDKPPRPDAVDEPQQATSEQEQQPAAEQPAAEQPAAASQQAEQQGQAEAEESGQTDMGWAGSFLHKKADAAMTQVVDETSLVSPQARCRVAFSFNLTAAETEQLALGQAAAEGQNTGLLTGVALQLPCKQGTGAGGGACCARQVHFRKNTTDYKVFQQIFQCHYMRYLYSMFGDNEPRYILDAGGNAGFSSLLFKLMWPKATVVALEPDESNFAMLQRNTAGFEGMHAINAGLWGRSANITVVGDHGNWGRVFREAKPGEQGMPAFSVQDVAAQLSIPAFDFVKIDIEGAEGMVFAPGSDFGWIPHAKVVSLEVHDYFAGYFGLKEVSSRIDAAFSPTGYAIVSDNEHIYYMSEEVQAAVAAQKPPSKLVVKIARSRNNLC